MPYDFSNLSSADFEDLCGDLIGAEEKIRFEAFCSGPDSGVDGRHSKSGESTILQVKHYVESTFPVFETVLRKELKSVKKLSPRSYILATSQKLTPARKKKIIELFAPYILQTSDIYGREDLNRLLRKHRDIEKSHVKLWLNSTTVLEGMLNSDVDAYSGATEEGISHRIRTYVENPSLKQAKEILDREKVLIISGAPGVGKTTLSEFISYVYISIGWKFVAIRNINEGFRLVNSSEKVIFHFDDFLGRIKLDKSELDKTDTSLVRFVESIKRKPNCHFILTTRAHIFEEARSYSDRIDSADFDVSKFVLDVGVYTRKIRAHIFYNHLFWSGLQVDYFLALLDSDVLIKLIDHPNYSPRIIETITKPSFTRSINPVDYPQECILGLERPDTLWSKPFNSLDARYQHLLFVLFFEGEYGTSIVRLELDYRSIHKALCNHYAIAFSSKDFEDAMKVLDGGFISITPNRVSPINPSLLDYLDNFLDDSEIVSAIIAAADTFSLVERIWEFSKDKSYRRDVVDGAKNFIPRINKHPRTRKYRRGNQTYTGIFDSSFASRVAIICDWWKESTAPCFAGAVSELIDDINNFDFFMSDGSELPQLVFLFGSSEGYKDMPKSEHFSRCLETKLIGEIANSFVDELVLIIQSVHESFDDDIPFSVETAIADSIREELEYVDSYAASYENSSDLEQYQDSLSEIGKLTGVDMSNAVSAVNDRMLELLAEEDSLDEDEINSFSKQQDETDIFEDHEIHGLFDTLRPLDG